MDLEAYIHFKSMLLSLSLHLLLFFFELLACDKLQSMRHMWVLVFLPLLFLSIVCIAISIWALKHERPFEVTQTLIDIDFKQLIFFSLEKRLNCQELLICSSSYSQLYAQMGSSIGSGSLFSFLSGSCLGWPSQASPTLFFQQLFSSVHPTSVMNRDMLHFMLLLVMLRQSSQDLFHRYETLQLLLSSLIDGIIYKILGLVDKKARC